MSNIEQKYKNVLYDTTSKQLNYYDNEKCGEIFNDYVNNNANGEYSHAEGYNTQANGVASHAEGRETIANGRYSHTEGLNTIANNEAEHAQGFYNISHSSDFTSGQTIHSIGIGTSGDCLNAIEIMRNGDIYIKGIGDYEGNNIDSDVKPVHEVIQSIVFNDNQVGMKIENGGEIFNSYFGEDERNKATGKYSHAEGLSTSALGNSSHAEGNKTVASGNSSHAEGNNTQANGSYSHSEGYNTVASGNSSHAEGNTTKAIGNYSHSEGYNTIASGESSHAEGANNKANGYASHVEGENNTSNSVNAHAEGYNNNANGDYSHAEGYNNNANTTCVHAEGNNNTSDGQFSHIEGTNNLIEEKGISSHAEGASNTISNSYSHAEGKSNIASGLTSHVEGGENITKGNYSHAEGYKTQVIGNYSHSEGVSTIVNGEASHAEGNETQVNGNYSHAEGYKTQANGIASHAEGNGTQAIGEYSHSEGFYTIASNLGEHASGKYNISESNYIYSVGIGTSARNRKNALTISDNGDVYLLNIGNYDGTNINTAESLNTKLQNLSNVGQKISNGGEIFNDYDNNTAKGYFSHAENASTTSNGYASHAEGQQTTANGYASHAEGNKTSANGLASHAEGLSTIAKNDSSHAEGKNTQANGYASHAEGEKTQAIGDYSHSEGLSTKANGVASHAEGDNSIAYNYASHAEGIVSYALGPNGSHAEGYHSISFGDYGSHAEGSYSNSYGEYSHAEGGATYALGEAPHSEGHRTFSLGHGSHSEGVDTVSSNIGSHSEGTGQYTQTTKYENNVVSKTNLRIKVKIKSFDYYTINFDSADIDTVNMFKYLSIGNTFLLIFNKNGVVNNLLGYETKQMLALTPKNIDYKNYIVEVYEDSIFHNNLATFQNSDLLNDNNIDIYIGFNYVGVSTQKGSHCEGNYNSAIGMGSHTEGGVTSIRKMEFSAASEIFNPKYFWDFEQVQQGDIQLASDIKLIMSGCEEYEIFNTLPYNIQPHNIYKITNLSTNQSDLYTVNIINKYLDANNNYIALISFNKSLDIFKVDNSENSIELPYGSNNFYNPNKRLLIEEISKGNRVYDENSHAENSSNLILSKNSHAEGQNNIILNDNSHIEGFGYNGLINIFELYDLSNDDDSIDDNSLIYQKYDEEKKLYYLGLNFIPQHSLYNTIPVEQFFIKNNYYKMLKPNYINSSFKYYSSYNETIFMVKDCYYKKSSDAQQTIYIKLYIDRQIKDDLISPIFQGPLKGVCNGFASHVEGINNNSNSLSSHAEGYNNNSNSLSSHAEGINGLRYYASGYEYATDTNYYPHRIFIQNDKDDNNKNLIRFKLNALFNTQFNLFNSYVLHNIDTNEIFIGKIIKKISYSDNIYELFFNTDITLNFVKDDIFNIYEIVDKSSLSSTGIAYHNEGINTYAINDGSHSEGINTIAYGIASHAEGFNEDLNVNLHCYITNISTSVKTITITPQSGTDISQLENYIKPYFLYEFYNEETSQTDCYIITSVSKTGSSLTLGLNKNFEIGKLTSSNIPVHIRKRIYSALGHFSHIEGYNTSTYGAYSHSEGKNTITTNEAEHAEGKYNLSNLSNTPSAQTLHSIGIGISTTVRKNALEVMANGDIYINGVGNYTGDNFAEATKLQDIINNLTNQINQLQIQLNNLKK